MKKICTFFVAALYVSIGFSANATIDNSLASSGSNVNVNPALTEANSVKPSDHATPMAMNATPSPLSKEAKEGNIPAVDQPKQQEQLVGSNSSTWTPAYLSVKKFKKCLEVENYRGWQGYCFPSEKPKNCPDKSWKQLSEMNLIPCSNSSN
ncbi:hypothetical protein [Francisella salimarina]|uniref:Uncharacterized protein n=1 Tax=Francisella salimarina TaxID=2599927 RepID=A0AAJ4NNP6_9GAMM|nr:hypothetical protein [Francisella salimarina]QWU99363.1 hypothetical protein KQR59_00320 [Francisella salimarina]